MSIPTCNSGPARLYILTADQVLTDSLALIPPGTAQPAAIMPMKNPVLTILFVVALLSGLTLRRRSARWLTLPMALVALIPFSSLLGCGSGPQGFTPGTYTYTLTASEYGSVTPLSEGANATVTIR